MATYDNSRARTRSMSEAAARAARERGLERALERETAGARARNAAYERQAAALAARATARGAIDRQTAERAARAAARAAALGGPARWDAGSRAFTTTRTHRDLARGSTPLYSTFPRSRVHPFLRGLGSIVDFFGVSRMGGMLDLYFRRPVRRTRPVPGITSADRLALERDWRVVGGDIERAMKSVDAEIRRDLRDGTETRNGKSRVGSGSHPASGPARATA